MEAERRAKAERAEGEFFEEDYPELKIMFECARPACGSCSGATLFPRE